jgi:hypothetical protein
MLELICYLVAVVLALLATFNVPARINLLALAIAFAIVPSLVHAIHTLT